MGKLKSNSECMHFHVSPFKWDRPLTDISGISEGQQGLHMCVQVGVASPFSEGEHVPYLCKTDGGKWRAQGDSVDRPLPTYHAPTLWGRGRSTHF
eukprot:221065-Chlamydomonas_euryale.AAC.1